MVLGPLSGRRIGTPPILGLKSGLILGPFSDLKIKTAFRFWAQVSGLISGPLFGLKIGTVFQLSLTKNKLNVRKPVPISRPENVPKIKPENCVQKRKTVPILKPENGPKIKPDSNPKN